MGATIFLATVAAIVAALFLLGLLLHLIFSPH